MANGSGGRYAIYIDNTDAERALDRLRTRATELTRRISEIQVAGGDASREIQRLGNTQQQIRSLETSISQGVTRSLRDMQNEVRRIEGLLARATDPATIRELNSQLVVARQNLLEYRANVLEVESAQNQLAEQNRTVWGRMAAGIQESMFGNLLARGIEMGISLLKNFLVDVINIGLAAEGIKEKFEKLDSPDLLRNLRAATRGTVSDLELMKKAVNADNFQIPLENLGTLLSFAQQRARETGEDIDYLTESIVVGIARKSTPILDNLGITALRVNEEFKKTGDFAKAVSNIVQQEMEKSGKYIDKQADRVARLGAWWDNVKGKAAEAIVAVVDDVDMVGARISGDQDRLDELIRRRLHMWSAQDAFGITFRENELRALERFKEEYKKLTADQQRDVLQITQNGLAASEEEQRKAIVAGNWGLATNLQTRLELWNNYFSKLNKSTQEGAKYTTLNSLNEELDILNKQVQGLDIEGKEYQRTQAAIKEKQKQIADATGQTAEEEARKADQKNKEIKRGREQLAKALEDLQDKILGYSLNSYQREILSSQRRYEELRAQAQKYGVETAEMDKLQAQENLFIWKKYWAERATDFAKGRDFTKDPNKELRKDAIAATGARVVKDADSLFASVQRRDKDNVYAKQYALSKSTAGDQLKAQLDLLEAERQQQLRSDELTQAERLLIEEQYRVKRKEAETKYYTQLADSAIQFLTTALNAYQTYSNAQAQKEQNELARDRVANDKKKELYKKQLDGKIISREQYDRKVAALDSAQEAKERAIKKKQFEREKIANITKATMGVAQAVVQMLTAGPFIGQALAASAAIMGAIQIAIIASQKPPEFGQGGRIRGPRHSDKSRGLPVTDPYTGRIQAYLEGDEGIIKRAAMQDKNVYSVRGTISQITSRLNGLHGGATWESGARFAPAWLNYYPGHLNYGGISGAMKVVKNYETGGIFKASTATTVPMPVAPAPDPDDEMKGILINNTNAFNLLSAQLATGIHAKVALSDVETQQKRIENVRSSATFKP